MHSKLGEIAGAALKCRFYKDNTFAALLLLANQGGSGVN
jgi:hypothetical protein